MNAELDELMKEYVKLSTEEKQKEIITSLKEDIAIIKKITELNNFESELIFNKEILDLKKGNPTNDDYLEAIYAYLKTLENIIGKLLIQKNK